MKAQACDLLPSYSINLNQTTFGFRQKMARNECLNVIECCSVTSINKINIDTHITMLMLRIAFGCAFSSCI